MADLTPTPPPGHVNGRFAPGNQWGKMGGGSPIAKEIIKLRQAFLACITPDEMRAVTRRHLELIKGKDGRVAVQALALLYDRLFGKATEKVDVAVTQTAPLDPASYTDDQLATVLEVLAHPARLASTTSAGVPVYEVEQ